MTYGGEVTINELSSFVGKFCKSPSRQTAQQAFIKDDFLIDENEVTLKRLHRKGKTIALEAANKVYETKIFGPDRVKVQGQLKAIFRQYS